MLWLSRARLTLLRQPIGEVIAMLQTTPAEAHNNATLAQRVSWAIRGAARILPFRTDCLIRSIAAHRVLHRYNINVEFHLQAGNDAAAGFQAHAWLESSGVEVAGQPHSGIGSLIGPKTH